MKFKEKKEFPWIWLAGTFLEKLWTLKKSKKFSKLEIKSQIMVDLSIQKKIFTGYNYGGIERIVSDTFD